jgi:hypothetical protein
MHARSRAIVVAVRTTLGRRIAAAYRAAAIVTFNSLVFLLCLEAAAVAVGKARDWLRAPVMTRAERMARSPYYASQEWAADYWRDHFQVSTGSLGRYDRAPPPSAWMRRGARTDLFRLRAIDA